MKQPRASQKLFFERRAAYSRRPSPEEHPFYYDLIHGLADKRKALGLTQEELNDMLGYSSGMLSKWEAFQRLPTSFTMMCWCQELGLHLKLVEHDDET